MLMLMHSDNSFLRYRSARPLLLSAGRVHNWGLRPAPLGLEPKRLPLSSRLASAEDFLLLGPFALRTGAFLACIVGLTFSLAAVRRADRSGFVIHRRRLSNLYDRVGNKVRVRGHSLILRSKTQSSLDTLCGPSWVPNFLTLLRVVAILPLLVLFYVRQSWASIACATVFGAAAVTDWLDGYLARRWGVSSAFGAFFDPVADKLIVGAALVLLPTAAAASGQAALLAVPAVVLTLREIFVSALREWMATVGQRDSVAVGWLGKCKTAFLLVSITGLLATCRVGPSSFVYRTGVVLLYAGTMLSAISGAEYLRAAWPALTTGSGVPGSKERAMPVRHVVMFSFKEDVTQKQISALKADFDAMPGKIDAIKDSDSGLDIKLPSGQNHPSGKNRAFVWSCDFVDEVAYESYATHPDHVAVLAKVNDLAEPGTRAAIQYRP